MSSRSRDDSTSSVMPEQSETSKASMPISAITAKDGRFNLPAHAADGQQVRLRAEKSGYYAVEDYHPAGREPVTLELKKLGERSNR